MRQLSQTNTISLVSGIDGDLQVAAASGLIILDVQGAHRCVDGVVRHDHGVVRLTYNAACDLRDLLDQIAEPIDTRQPTLPAIWCDASFTRPVARSRRRRAA